MSLKTTIFLKNNLIFIKTLLTKSDLTCIISVEKQKGGNIMNFVELEKNLVDIVNQKTKECENQLVNLDKNAKMEQKALIVQKAMYDNFLRIGLLYYTTGSRENAIRCKEEGRRTNRR